MRLLENKLIIAKTQKTEKKEAERREEFIKSLEDKLAKTRKEVIRAKTQKTKAEQAQEILRAIKQGAKFIKEIAEKTGLSQGIIYEHARAREIEVPGYKLKKCDEGEIIDMALHGPYQGVFSLEQIIKQTNSEITKQGVLKILYKEGVHEAWVLAKKDAREKKQELRGIITRTLKEVTLKKAEQEYGWAYKKALEYDLLRQRNYRKNISFSRLIELFQTYKDIKEKGKKISLWELGEYPDISGTTIGRIFKSVGLKPMYGNKRRRCKKELSENIQLYKR